MAAYDAHVTDRPAASMTRALAQRIVDRTMERLGHNVNVMDADGVIVGTGEPERLGSVHEGALLAIRGGRTVVVDEEMAARMHGVRVGVNLPLMSAGSAVGAIGVSGDPQRLGEVAELLRMTAELMVEQAGELDEEQRRSSRLPLLVAEMIDPGVEPDRVAAAAAAVGVDATVPRRVLLLVAARAGAALPDDGERAAATVHAARRALHRSDLGVLTREVPGVGAVVLAPRAVALESLWRALGPGREAVDVVVGGDFGDGLPGEAGGLAQGAASAFDALAARGRHGSIAWRDDPLVALIAGLPGDWRVDLLGEPWSRLRAADDLLARTVLTYLTSRGDLERTGTALGVHRNTLRHRLRRAAEVAGADVREPEGATAFVIGAIRDGYLCMRTAWE